MAKQPKPAPVARPPLPDGPDDRSVAWYLNWLANTLDPQGVAPFTEKDAACRWAGVSQVDFNLVGALNLRAGNTDHTRWLPVREVLNQISQGASRDEFPKAGTPMLTVRQALLKICEAQL